MKKIFFPSILFMVLLAAGVSAKVDVNYNFYDIHTTYAVNNVDTLVYPCLDAGCNNLMLSRSLPGTGNSGSSSNTIVTYPTNLITKYGYAAFYFEPGYVPEEAKADWSGNGNTRYSIPFNKIFYCKSNITEFDVGADANGDVAINSSIRSAFSRANKIVGYTPPAYIDYYSSLVRTNVTVYNEDNAVVYESARTDNILMDGNVDFNLSFNLASGNYTAVIVTNVTDDQCASSLTRERQVEFEIPEIPTPIEPLNVTLTANLISGSEPLNVSLNCSVQGGESQYNYSFYDNMVLFFNRITDSNSISLTRTFSAGNHTATCFVSDSDGRNDSDSVMITVNATHIPECRDSIDNDGDGLIDYPTDSGCENPGDDNETDMITPPECSDLIDNDGDGFIDYPADPGCVNATDDDEYNNNTINEAPLVTLRFPSDNSSFSIGNLVFIYGVVDDYSPLLSCTFYSNITGTFAPMMSQVTANGGIGFFNTLGIPDGAYVWNVLCSDGLLSAFAPRNWTVTVNTTGYNDIPAEVNITANPSTGNYPLNVQFTSSVRGNSPIIYSWTFGDGAISNVPNPQHTYPNAGTYTATLTITDADGDIASAYIVITVTTSGASSDGNDEENKDHQAEYGLYIGRIKIFSDAEKNYGEEYVKAGHELYVDTFFENLGSKDLENIEYRVMMPDLGIMNAAKFNLDSGDHLTSRVVLDVPEGVKLGDYDVQISASNDQVRRVKYRFVTVIE